MDGAYPRLNGAMLQSGLYSDIIVSLVGKFDLSIQTEATVAFHCCDGQTTTISLDQAELPPNVSQQPDMVYEIIGQLSGGTVAMFVARELSVDMDLAVYNQMIELQNSPKYKDFFGGSGLPGNGMVTN